MNDYSEFVGLMYKKGFYVTNYNINKDSKEISYNDNKIVIKPINEEELVYVFTGISQKENILSEPTEFKLLLENKDGNEFKDDDLIMISTVKENQKNYDLYTRPYATWKFGIKFEKGIYLDKEKYLIIQAQKEIGKFDIKIKNVDLFKYKDKKNIKDMMWID